MIERIRKAQINCASNIFAAGNLVKRITKFRAERSRKDIELKFLLGISDYRGTPEKYFKTVVEDESLLENVTVQMSQLIK
jgi:hypothetical protein